MREPAFVQAARAELIRRHGRKQGLLRSVKATVRFLLGQYADLENVDWARVERLVFVCTGNICRSPYAEARARQLGCPAISAGVATRNGVAADPQAVGAARERGLDLSGHRSRAIAGLSLRPGDLLVAMEPRHLEAVRSPAAEAGAQATLLGLWNLPVRPHLEDPFGLSPGYFQSCFEVIDGAVDRLCRELRHSPPRLEAASRRADRRQGRA